MYDVTRRETFTNLSDIWAKEIDLFSTNQDCIKMLVGNKVDKVCTLSHSVVDYFLKFCTKVLGPSWCCIFYFLDRIVGVDLVLKLSILSLALIRHLEVLNH